MLSSPLTLPRQSSTTEALRAKQGQPAPVGNVSSEAGQASDPEDATFNKTARCFGLHHQESRLDMR